MPAAKGQQSGTMLYAVVTTAALFIIATVAAVVFYIRAEAFRKDAANMRKEISQLATDKERRDIAKIVGAKKARQSRLGTMAEYVDETVSLIIGEAAEGAPAKVKVESARNAVENTLAQLSEELAETDAATANPGLIRVVEILKQNLEDARSAAIAIDRQLEHVQKLFDQAKLTEKEKENQLHEQMQLFAREAHDVQQSFDRLQQQMEQNSEQQIQFLRARLEKADHDVRAKQQQLLKTQAELKRSEQRRSYYQQQLDAIKPRPDSDVPAFKADGKILSVDNRSEIVFLNIGSDDHVYRGLTFSVYDKNVPIPRDGKGKAEIEVFDVERNVSVARVTSRQSRQPVVPDDVVANLIWDSEASNIFVVTGEFDFDGDGLAELDGTARVIGLVEKWGGTVADGISVETDFVVLGTPPKILSKPTHEQVEMDPMAIEKYEESLQKYADYQEIRTQTKALSIPIFNLDRFLYFTGYKTLASKDTSF